ncbi:hypothetical protein P8C59_006678 [Phyllachora maydis]|uniref:Uncharacterized protein n=1 Tax=Phyllachora maydis TaxID=1825666 RepID=A0AAD9MFS4_9PEZI|nr:hypothetical protein P8C59_006678 [Phyllachora maydis]
MDIEGSVPGAFPVEPHITIQTSSDSKMTTMPPAADVDSGYFRINLAALTDEDAMHTDSSSAPTSAVSPRTPLPSALQRAMSIRSTASSTSSPTMAFAPLAARLQRSDSARSAGRMSVRSHTSVRAIGALPYGTLEVVHASDDPGEDEDEDGGATASETLEKRDMVPDPSSVYLADGSLFLVLEHPTGCTLGYDNMAATVESPRVLGVRGIPPGAHFFWLTGPGRLSWSGYWFVTTDKSDVRVKQWDRFNETLGDVASKFEERDAKENLDLVYNQLIPYTRHFDGHDTPTPPTRSPVTPVPVPCSAQSMSRKASAEPDFAADSGSLWHFLASHVTEEYLARVTGNSRAREWLVDTTDAAQGEAPFPAADKVLKMSGSTEFHFSLPARDVEDQEMLANLSIDSDVARPVEAASDPEPHVQKLIAAAGDSATVGELQFTFLTGAHLANYTCIEQWWHVVLRVVLRAPRLAVTRPLLCRRLLQTLHAQMIYNDRHLGDAAALSPPSSRSNSSGGRGRGGSDLGILDVVPGNKRRLREALTRYKQRLDGLLLGLGDRITPEQAAVGHAFADLEALFWKHGWELRSPYVPGAAHAAAGDDGSGDDGGGDDDDDYAPVVVRVDQDGRQADLVSWN